MTLPWYSNNVQMVWGAGAPLQALSKNSITFPLFYFPEVSPVRNTDFDSIATEIEALGSLQEDWNGYGTRPVSDDVRNNALSFLVMLFAQGQAVPDPEIIPRANGTIGFSWESPESEAYLEIGKTRYSGYVVDADSKRHLFEGRAASVTPEFLTTTYETLFEPSRGHLVASSLRVDSMSEKTPSIVSTEIYSE